MKQRQAVLLTIRPPSGETLELAYAGGLRVVETVHQGRDGPDNRTFLGRGAIQALEKRFKAGRGDTAREERDHARLHGRHKKEYEKEQEKKEERQEEDLTGGAAEGPPLESIDVVLVAHDLKPSQILRLQKGFGVEVWDRTRLILEIFTDRASSEEARLQVELARLHYELPLVREAIHLAKTGERPGFMGGGEMGFVEYQTHIRGRMARIRQELDVISRERDVRRSHRRRGGFWLLALAGYTNAGKSTLLNALSEGGAVAENRLFSTLATRTRRVTLGGASRLLLTDTVGFIEDLPPWLVDAFHATLEEVVLADVVLLVVDASDPLDELRRKLFTSLRTLRQLRSGGPSQGTERLLLVFNKTDLPGPAREDVLATAERVGLEDHCVFVSAVARQGLEGLLAAARQRLADRVGLRVQVPADGAGSAFVAWAADYTEARIQQANGWFELALGVAPGVEKEVTSRLKAAGGRVVTGPVAGGGGPDGSPGNGAA